MRILPDFGPAQANPAFPAFPAFTGYRAEPAAQTAPETVPTTQA